jgi:hypothetical protein
MEQKPTNKLLSIQCHLLDTIVIGGIPIPEGHPITFQ